MSLHDGTPVSLDNSDESDHDCEAEAPLSLSSSSAPSVPNNMVKDMKVLLQQQQAMLRTIITKQESMEASQTVFENKLAQLEDKINVVTPPSSNDSSPSGKKRKRFVSRELSVSYDKLIKNALFFLILIIEFCFIGAQ